MTPLITPLHEYLLLMTRSRLLISERDEANIDILLTLLGELDRTILCHYYGLFSHERLTLTALAERYKVGAEVMQEIIEKDLRKVAITPDWQALAATFTEAVKRRIGL